MGAFFKFLLFFLLAYFIFSWVRSLIVPSPQKRQNEKEVRIFKSKDVEKPRVDVQDAETIDFEEIKDPRNSDVN